MTTTAPPARPRRAALSVRTRIVAVITAVAFLGMAVVGLTVYLVERTVSLEAIEGRLQDNLESARIIVAGGPDGPEGTTTWTTAEEALRAVVQRMSPDDNTGAIGIIDGKARFRSGVGLDIDLTAKPGFVPYVVSQVTGNDPRIGTYAEEGVVWRYLAAPIAISGGDPNQKVIFAMAYDVRAELDEINGTAQAYVVASVIALVVIALVASLVSGRLLRPLRQMRETAERVTGQALTERLPVQGTDDVSELAATMNDMLDRLDNALDSQRQLLSDVGHELKTPITIVRGNLEVMDPADPDDVRETRDLAIDELERMAMLVQDLAAAAALHGPRPIAASRVDVAELLQQIVRKAEGIDGATVSAGESADVVAILDPARITQAMLQLAQNGVSHGGGRIEIGSRVRGETLELWVRDNGPGVPDADKAMVFDRFHRGGDDRGGSGLGLNIVQVIARAHGGSVRVEDADGGGAMFVIAVPLDAATMGDVPPRPPLPDLMATTEGS
ncbi:sensor histidine kinase [Microbacterium sp. TNHR37B]|uniref:sensor histidine kinase n=1 Tax=Microbacterium sp. TNHR37B TaxID=1775956 RepID=UPI0007B2DFA9|nr:HAMP domain-containing sensor histidine kinase [Microbacterium sp. TNHR37B]KZE88719.1 Signal transduction histidine-protein kinase ArlS [Microbacterium sp. TNHR37B]